MDVEKTIEFILQTQARQQETIDSLTRVAELHSQQIGQLDGAMRTMAEAMVEAHNRTQEQFRRTDEQFRRTDERIDRLVGAMGEWIRRENNGKKK